MPDPASRPPVSVVVPFAGSAAEAARLARSLGQIALTPADELIVADNSPVPVAAQELGSQAGTVRASRERSSYHARNVGAAEARNEWILFLDADCQPSSDLLDAYFDPMPGPEVGALAGAVDAAPATAFAARWAASRRYLDPRGFLEAAVGPGAITANLLVRRAAFEAIGGFREGIRSGGDLEFSWRLGDAGYPIEYRAGARVAHRHRERIGAALAQARRCGAGNAWQNRVRPGSSPRPRPLAESARALARSVRALFRLDPSEARFALMDGAIALARARGYRESNDASATGGNDASTGGDTGASAGGGDR